MIPHNATRQGDMLVILLQRDPDAQAIAFDMQAPLLTRVLAAASSGTMRPAVVEAMIRDDAALRQEALALVGAEQPTLAGRLVSLLIPLEGG